MKHKEQSKAYKIFISHSSVDENFVGELVKLLAFLGINSETDIIRSSHDVMSEDTQDDFFRYFLNQHKKYNLLILFIHSANYYNSNICQNEMGVAWTLRTKYFSFFVKGFDYSKVSKSICRKENFVNVDLMDAEDKMSDLRDLVLSCFSKEDNDKEKWDEICREFLNNVNSLPEYKIDDIYIETENKLRFFNSTYLPIVEKIFQLVNIEEYSSWTYKWACSGYPMITIDMYNKLHELDSYLRQILLRPEFPELNKLLKNLSVLIGDYVKVMDLHILKMKDGQCTVDRFYRGIPNNPCFDTDFYEYTEYCFLINDLTFELTRLLNLLIERIRIKLPNYLSDIPYILIDRKNKEEVLYSYLEKSDSPYPGLDHFLSVRKKRTKFFGKETELEFFNL